MNALCNLSRKKLREVAASLPGQFLSRRCFTLWKMNLELRSSTKATTVAKITGERGWRVGKKCFCVVFLADQKIASSWKKVRFGASYRTSKKLLLVAKHILTTGIQKCLLSWQCKIRKFTVTAFHCEESTYRK